MPPAARSGGAGIRSCIGRCSRSHIGGYIRSRPEARHGRSRAARDHAAPPGPDRTPEGGGGPSGVVRGVGQRFHRRRRRSGTTGAGGRSSSAASSASCPAVSYSVVTRTAGTGSGGRGLACRGDPLGRAHTTAVPQPPQTQARGTGSPRGRRCRPVPCSSVHAMPCPTTGRTGAARPAARRLLPGGGARVRPDVLAGSAGYPCRPTPQGAAPGAARSRGGCTSRAAVGGRRPPRALVEALTRINDHDDPRVRGRQRPGPANGHPGRASTRPGQTARPRHGPEPGPGAAARRAAACGHGERATASRGRSNVRPSPGAHQQDGPAGWEPLPSGPSPTHAPPTTSNQGRETDRRGCRIFRPPEKGR